MPGADRITGGNGGGKKVPWCGISREGLSGARSLEGNLEDNIPGRRNSLSAKALLQQKAKIYCLRELKFKLCSLLLGTRHSFPSEIYLHLCFKYI